MQKHLILLLISFLIFSSVKVFAQQNNIDADSVEVYLIDSYVTPEKPHNFVLSFFTSAPCKAKVNIANKYYFDVSNKLTANHKIKIDISKLDFTSKDVPFVITVTDSAGRTFKSEQYDFELPKEIKVKSESSFLMLCLFGGAVFALPSPTYVWDNNNSYFSLTKEIPLFSIRSSDFGYPVGYFSIEYSHVFNADIKNYFRVGYKHIFRIPGLQYVSPGINGFTNFKGFNGISPEVSVGLVRILNAFTVYTRYRFNFKPGDSAHNFSEISIGLYSGFFSVYF